MKMRIDKVVLLSFLLVFCSSMCFGETVVHWKFDEGAGQSIANSEGSSTINLQIGNYLGGTSSDPWEPAWDTGLFGGAVRGNKPSDNGGKTTFCKNTASWTSSDAVSLVPTGSYTIEMIINNSDFPADTAPSSLWQSILAYRDTATSQYQYLLRLLLRDIGGEDHQTVYFYSQNSDAARQIFCDLTAQSFVMVPGKWYYVAAVYDNSINSMNLIVRDLETGVTATGSGTMRLPIGMGTTPAPEMLIGTESTAQRSFSGLIDEVRISNGIVLEDDRLYNIEVPNYLRGDVNQDGSVDLLDFAILAQNWLE